MFYIVMILVLLADQFSKILSLKYLKTIGDIPIINNIFHLTYVENRGAAFGILQGQKLFFIITTVLVLAFILFYINTNRVNKVMLLGLALVAGGAIGNVIDRIRLGFVVDFLNLVDLIPVFNIADSAVVVGTILISFFIIRHDY